MQAMIFAAGLGTRLRPLTDDRPKAMVEVAGRPLLEHVILKLRRQGFDHIVVNVHHFGEQIIDFLQEHDNFGMDLRVSDERDLLLNTGGGLKRALPLLRADEPVLIHNVDIACDIDLGRLYDEAVNRMERDDALLVTNQRKTSRFLLYNKEGLLRGWLNEGAGSKEQGAGYKEQGAREPDIFKLMGKETLAELQRLPFTGIHVLMPRLFTSLAAYPDEVFSIIDFYLSVCADARLVARPLGDDCRWVDCGRVEMLPRAEEIWQGSSK